MTTDRKNFIFTVRRGIMAEIEYPGVVQLIERVVWDHEAASLSLATRTKIPLKSTISEGFFLFFVYCGAEFESTFTKLLMQMVNGSKIIFFEPLTRKGSKNIIRLN